MVKNEFHKNLIGEWIWEKSCGGITGRCVYADSLKHRYIEFDYNLNYTEKLDDSILNVTKYRIQDKLLINNVALYAIALDGGNQTYYKISGPRLSIQGSDLWKEYNRVSTK